MSPDFSFHGLIANTSQMYFLALAIWSFWRFFRKKGLDSNFWGALAIGEGLIIIEVLIGMYLYFIMGLRPARGGMHLLYGFLVPTLIPFVYSYTKGREEYAESLAYGTTLIIAAGLIFRAIGTGKFALEALLSF